MPLKYPWDWEKNPTEQQKKQWGLDENTNSETTPKKDKTVDGSANSNFIENKQPSTDIFYGIEGKEKSYYIPENKKIKYDYNEKGEVVGIHDPIEGKSYAIQPTKKEVLENIEKKRYNIIQNNKEIENEIKKINEINRATGELRAEPEEKNFFKKIIKQSNQELFSIERQNLETNKKNHFGYVLKSVIPATKKSVAMVGAYPIQSVSAIGSGVVVGAISKNPALAGEVGSAVFSGVGAVLTYDFLYNFKKETDNAGFGTETTTNFLKDTILFSGGFVAGEKIGTTLVNKGLMPSFEKITISHKPEVYKITKKGEIKINKLDELPFKVPDVVKEDIYKGFTLGKKATNYNVEKIKTNLETKYNNVFNLEGDTTHFKVRFIEDFYKGKPESTAINYGYNIVNEIYGKNSPILRELPEKTKTLSKESTKKVYDFVKKNNADLYGSATATAQLPKDMLAKGRGIKKDVLAIGDFDISIKNSKKKTQELFNILSKTEKNIRIAPDKPSLIQKKLGKNWVNAIDLHEKGSINLGLDLYSDYEIPQLGLGKFFEGKNIRSKEGINIMKLSEFGHRKGSSILNIKEGKLMPEKHRIKDISDFITTSEFLSEDKTKVNFLKEFYKTKKLYNSIKTTKINLISSKQSKKISFMPFTFIYSNNYKTSFSSSSINKVSSLSSIKSKSISSILNYKSQNKNINSISKSLNKSLNVSYSSYPSKPKSMSPKLNYNFNYFYPNSPSISQPKSQKIFSSVIPPTAPPLFMFPFNFSKSNKQKVKTKKKYFNELKYFINSFKIKKVIKYVKNKKK